MRAVLLIAPMMIFLAACGGQKPADSGAGASSSVTAPPATVDAAVDQATKSVKDACLAQPTMNEAKCDCIANATAEAAKGAQTGTPPDPKAMQDSMAKCAAM